MNLDEQIAKLKGFSYEVHGERVVICSTQGVECDSHGNGEYPAWSTSDAKALELVDEFPAISLRISLNIETDVREAVKDGYLRTCGYIVGLTVLKPGTIETQSFIGKGPTRPEAICRAYLAARESMATKAGA